MKVDAGVCTISLFTSKMCCSMECIGYITVTLIALKLTYNLAHFFYISFLGALLGKNIDLRQHGPWAVVTGATDGIGKAYAFKLASLGLNIVLISRTQEKLDHVAQQIKEQNGGVQVKCIAVDFTQGDEIYRRIRTELDELEVGVLVNNVGMCFCFGESFCEFQQEKLLVDMVTCNTVSMVRMSKMVLAQMVRRRKGIILNIGSLAGIISTPYATLYGATKAFVDKFSRDLNAEVRKDGVLVQTVLPGLVASNMSRVKQDSFTVPSPKTFVESSLRTIGLESRSIPFWLHRIQGYFGETSRFFIPEIIEDISGQKLIEFNKMVTEKAD